MIGLTYIREQEIIAWHRHDFDGGFVESVCCIPEGGEDVVYMIVKRKIDGVWTKYHERLSSRFISDETEAIIDMKFMDSHLTYDGRNYDDALTMTLSGGTDWTNGQPLTLTASTSFFKSTDVGNKMHIWRVDSDGNTLATKLIVDITGYTSGTVVTVNPERTVVPELRTIAVNTWARAVDEIEGLWHLEGQDVSVFGDGYVEASPYNNNIATVVTVQDGTIELSECYAVIHVGLPYISDLQTLDVDSSQSETTIDKNKLFGNLTAFVEKTNSFWAGHAAPSDDSVDALENLREATTRTQTTDPEVSPELVTGKIKLTIQSQWKPEGSVFVRQVDPSPLAIQAIAPAGYVPIGG